MHTLTPVLSLRATFNAGRGRSIKQEAVARIRRAPKNERPGLLMRYARRLRVECLRVRVE